MLAVAMVAEMMRAGFAGTESIENLIDKLKENKEMDGEGRAMADAAVLKFKKFISLLSAGGRTGHARFRRAPVSLPVETLEDDEDHSEIVMEYLSVSRVYCPRPLQQLPPLPPHQIRRELRACSPPCSTSDSLKRKCGLDDVAMCEGRCHCSKRRKFMKARRTVRVPAVSMKMAEIPQDDFSWRKYGQKPIKGSPHPRGYYKCSTVRGCPARKHVERAFDDPTMMIVTYEGDHNHILPASYNVVTSENEPPRVMN